VNVIRGIFGRSFHWRSWILPRSSHLRLKQFFISPEKFTVMDLWGFRNDRFSFKKVTNSGSCLILKNLQILKNWPILKNEINLKNWPVPKN